ncbi:DsbA family protein [Candidatus Saccharibacteria bacterium]|nr:DsbA family protein [Candidatus Saccharibacteria bacterium]
MSKTAWITFAVICIGVLGGLVYMSSQEGRVSVEDVNANSILSASEDSGNIGDRVYGNRDAKVVLIEYGDYQCPGCAEAAPSVKSVKEQYGDDLAFVFRNFPLTQIHPNARVAAAAAEAAGEQGKFWEMHDLLYAEQTAWSTLSSNARSDYFLSQARTLELDQTKFSEDLASSQVNQKINFDIALGRKQQVEATPSFYLNGEALSQEQWNTEEALREAVEAALQDAGVELSATEN